MPAPQTLIRLKQGGKAERSNKLFESTVRFVSFEKVKWRGTCASGFSEKPSDSFNVVPGP
jgi:hypothetical protein